MFILYTVTMVLHDSAPCVSEICMVTSHRCCSSMHSEAEKSKLNRMDSSEQSAEADAVSTHPLSRSKCCAFSKAYLHGINEMHQLQSSLVAERERGCLFFQRLFSLSLYGQN